MLTANGLLPQVPPALTISRIIPELLRNASMDRETFDATIIAFKNRRPFRPFTLSLVNGERLEIDHPDALAIREGVGLFVGPGRIPSFFDNEGVARVIGDLANSQADEP